MADYQLTQTGSQVQTALDKVGTVALNTTATDLSGAVNELLGTIGTDPILTTAQTLTGAVNELNAKAPAVATTSNVGVVKPDGTSVAIDGTGTISTVYGGFSMTLVWTNPNPSSSFALQQTLSIDLSGYKAVAIYFGYSTASQGDRFGGLFPIGFPDNMIMYAYTGSSEANRTMSSITSSGITFDSGTNANNIIPLRIYGVK